MERENEKIKPTALSYGLDWLCHHYLIVTIALIGLILRAASIGWSGLSCDEAQQWAIVNNPNLFHWLTELKSDGNPPLIYFITWPFVLIFGKWIFPEKLLALFLSATLPLVAYFLLIKRTNTFVALQASTLMAFAPQLIRYGDLIRNYGLAYIFYLVATIVLIDLLKNDQKHWTKYVLLLTASLYLHLFTFVLIGAHAWLVLDKFRTHKISPVTLKNWLLAIAASALLFSPWLLVMISQLPENLAPWNPHLTGCVLVNTTVYTLFFDTYGYKPSEWYPLLAAIQLMVAAIFVGFTRSEDSNHLDWLFVVIGAMVGCLLLFAIGAPWRERYISLLSPIVFVYLGLTSKVIFDLSSNKQLEQKMFLQACSLLPATWLLAWYIWADMSLIKVPESQINRALKDYRVIVDCRKDAVIICPEIVAPEAVRILGNSAMLASFPESAPYVVWKGLNQRIRDNKRLEEFLNRMRGIFDKGGSVWLLFQYIPNTIPNTLLQAKYQKHHRYMWYEISRSLEIRDWLMHNAHKKAQEIVYESREGVVLCEHFVR